MKIAVSSKGQDLDAQVDPRFGRAAYLIIVDTETFEFEALDNTTNVNAFKGAGIQAATRISEKGADVLVTGFCGPNAFKVLNAANIDVANDIDGIVKDAVQAFTQGHVAFADKANVEGHW